MHPEVIVPIFGLPAYQAFTIYVAVGLIIMSLIIRSRLRLVPGKFQSMIEIVIEGFDGLWVDMVGNHSKQYMSLPLTFFMFILVSNVLGLIPGLMPPTSYINVAAGLMIVAVTAPHILGVKKQGFKYIKHFTGDVWWLVPIFFPIELIGYFVARPLSLSLRLFGNIMGHEFIVFVLIGFLMPLGFPLLLFTTALGVLVVLVQALIFSILTTAYIGSALEESH